VAKKGMIRFTRGSQLRRDSLRTRAELVSIQEVARQRPNSSPIRAERSFRSGRPSPVFPSSGTFSRGPSNHIALPAGG
jgi:hypothetical protein